MVTWCANSRTLRGDTYSPYLTEENISPGNPFIKISKVYFLKSVQNNGIPIFNHSRSPRMKRTFFINPGFPPIYKRDMKALLVVLEDGGKEKFI